MSLFTMPSLGADMESAVLVEWKVKVGDAVKKGDIIAEIETSKGIIEIEVFEDGVVEEILVEEETECTVGTPLANIRTEGTASKPEAAVPETPVTAEEVQTEEKPGSAPPEEPAREQMPEPSTVPKYEARVYASPAARQRARELGVDMKELAGEKPLHLKDIEPHGEKQPAQTSKPTESKKTVPADAMRQAIAKAMSRSNAEIPHYYLSTSINMSPALEWLGERNASRSIKDRILPAAMLLYATVQVLKTVPELNGFWRNDGHEISDAIHPGFAIALRSGGLITPAMLDAQAMTLDQTMEAMGDLIARTRSGKLRGAELSQQTITITNLGDLGVESVFGVIYPPQVALIGLGRIVDAPWAEEDTLSVRKVMQATLAGDHRATDGRTGALFLDRLKTLLENPKELE